MPFPASLFRIGPRFSLEGVTGKPWQLGLGLALVSLCAAALPAQTPLTVEDLGEAWRWRVFEGEKSLPGGPPTVLGHGHLDDVVYVATNEGLYRYNGYVWTRIQSAEGVDPYPIREIVAGRQVFVVTPRDVWVVRGGYELHRILEGGRPQAGQEFEFLLAASPSGGVFVIDLRRRKQYRIESDDHVRELDELPRSLTGISDYVVDKQRVHWLATSAGLHRRDLQGGYGWAPAAVRVEREDGTFEELRGLPCRRLFLVKFQQLKRYLDTSRVTAGQELYELWARLEDAEGKPVLLRRRDRIWKRVSLGDPSVVVSELIRDGEGNYYATSEDRLYFSRDGDSWQLASRLGIGEARVRSGLVDGYGLVWYAYDYSMGVGGVAWFDPLSRRWERVDASDAGRKLRVLSVLQASDGTTWLGTVSGLRVHGADGSVAVKQGTDDGSISYVTGLAEDHAEQSSVWVSSSQGFPGVLRFAEPGGLPSRPEYRPPSASRGLQDSHVLRIVKGRRQDLWFLSAARSDTGTAHRLYRVTVPRKFGVEKFAHEDLPFGESTSGGERRVNDLLEAQDGTFWVATDSGLAHVHSWSPLEFSYHYDRETRSDGPLLDSNIWALEENDVDGSIWISYFQRGRGVTRLLDGAATHYDETSGLASANVWTIGAALSSFGSRIWVGTDRGLSCFDGEAWYNYTVASFKPGETPQVWTLSPAATEDGDVLLGTLGNGAFRFRLENPRRPRFLARRFSSSQKRDGSVAFSWDARDYKDQTPPEELLYSHRVDGQPWSPFAPQTSVTFREGLEPDVVHTFQVEVRDRDGNPARDPITHHFRAKSPAAVASWILWVLGALASIFVAAASILVFVGVSRWRQPAYRLRGAFDGLASAAFILDARGRIVDYNGAHAGELGLEEVPRSRLAGLPFHLVSTLGEEEARRLVHGALSGHAGRGEVRVAGPSTGDRFVLRATPLYRRSGGVRPGESSVGAVVQLEDTTEEARRLADERRRQRLAAVRDLAGRVRDQLGPLLDAPPGLAVDRNGGGNLEELARALEEFSRPRRAETSAGISVAEVVEDVLGSPEAEGGPGAVPSSAIDLDMRAQPGLWRGAVDREAFRRVVSEILRNAREAMPEGGRLSVRLSNRRLERAGDLAPGRYVEISIADAGGGMDLQQAERVFDPFFSTKARDRHRGLGLTVAYGLIHQSGGDILLESKTGAGTRVRIFVPAVASEGASRPVES